ncbi:hypothetical protein [Desulfovibrio sp. JC010]|uniref:hypothetical protein n=1 Tax=Desulfovibrio sp. JC010 TaxID=2593641 RepID=UPI0013D12938|nr:hypothetical protein [Desulfovibrio sp. JC010]NDV26728.1 hypothetical protein [Desulfovibrio sp. JC010]
MRNLRIVAFVLVACALFLGGCRTAPIQNIELAPIATPNETHLTMKQVKNAIIRGGYDRGWQMSDVAPGHLVATLNIRSHQAIVDITYTPENYSINYKDSTNLKHKGNVIHSNYNAWIKNLANSINLELSRLN